jgi:methionyl-tRNA formyltransferase
MRIVFAGTPDFAAKHLESLLSAGFNIVSAYSQPDRPSGRGKQLQPTPVKRVALAAGIPVKQPLHLDPEACDELRDLNPDIIVVVAYGLLLSREVLDLPSFGCINVHASLLPRWRGAAPIEYALMSGDAKTGVSLMRMDPGLDSGPVLAYSSTNISDDDDSGTLSDRLCSLGCELLVNSFQKLPTLLESPVPQNTHLVSYAPKITKLDAKFVPSVDALKIHNKLRALFPRSPLWCLHQGQRLRLLKSKVLKTEGVHGQPGEILKLGNNGMDLACGNGILRVLQVQAEGRKPMAVATLLNGHADFFKVGQILHEPINV